MTEQEAIWVLKDFDKQVAAKADGAYQSTIGKMACDVAISALEEIQQYRALEQRAKNLFGENYDLFNCVEELREAREKQVPKKPILSMNEQSGMFVDYADGHGEYKVQTNNWWRCPCCNSVVGQRVIVHKHVHDQRKKKYCKDCGQAILWE